MNGAGISVNQAVVFPSPILTHSTKTPFPPGNTAPPWAQFTLDLSTIQGSEIGGELCLDEAFGGHLCPQGFRKTQDVSEAKSTETRPAKFQELPFREVWLRDTLTHPAASRVEQEGEICKGFTHVIYSLKNGLNTKFLNIEIHEKSQKIMRSPKKKSYGKFYSSTPFWHDSCLSGEIEWYSAIGDAYNER